MKKLISFILCIAMIFAMAVPCAAANKVYYSEYPVIILHGLGTAAIGRDGKVASDGKDEVVEVLKNEEFLDLLGAELLLSKMTGDWKPYADLIYDYIAPCFTNIRLEDNGECYSTPGGKTYNWSWSYDTLGGGSSKYQTGAFNYYIDYRLDPMAIAKDFSDYIDAVLNKTGAAKVKLFVRCMGSNVLFSYLAQNESAFSKISDICLYIPMAMGVDLIGAAFSGRLFVESNSLESWSSYIIGNTSMDSATKDLITASLEILNTINALGLTADEINDIFAQVRDLLIPRLVMATFGTFPGYWGLVPEKYFNNAVDYIFSYEDYKTRYSGIVEKINRYDKLVRNNIDALMDKAEARGIKISVISKYNIPVLPFFEGCEASGDGTALTETLSLGAVSGVCNKALTDYYLQNIIGTNREKYLSPDKMIDASTCRFPERTWFIKDNVHGTAPANLYHMADFIFSDNVNGGNVTVTTDTENWPQYLGYDAERNMIVNDLYEATEPEEEKDNSPFASLVRFFTKIMNFFTNLFKKGFNFGNLFGKKD